MGTFLNEILFTYLLAVIFKIKSISTEIFKNILVMIFILVGPADLNAFIRLRTVLHTCIGAGTLLLSDCAVFWKEVPVLFPVIFPRISRKISL